MTSCDFMSSCMQDYYWAERRARLAITLCFHSLRWVKLTRWNNSWKQCCDVLPRNNVLTKRSWLHANPREERERWSRQTSDYFCLTAYFLFWDAVRCHRGTRSAWFCSLCTILLMYNTYVPRIELFILTDKHEQLWESREYNAGASELLRQLVWKCTLSAITWKLPVSKFRIFLCFGGKQWPDVRPGARSLLHHR